MLREKGVNFEEIDLNKGLTVAELEQLIGARGRMLLHVALAIEFIAGIQKLAVIARADQLLELGDRESFIEIDYFEFNALFAKQTLRLAAGGSTGFQIELHHSQFRSA